MGFNYNRINPNFIKSVELISADSDEWWNYKKQIFDSSKSIPESRQEIINDGDTKKFERILNDILYVADSQDFIEPLYLDAGMWQYIDNAPELIEQVKREGWNVDLDVKIADDATVGFRGRCKHSQSDSFQDSDSAMCCWECSSKSNNRPEKFDREDDPVEECELSIVPEWKVRSHIQDNLAIDPSSRWGEIFQEANYSPLKVASISTTLSKDRTEAVKLAYKAAFPEWEYHYNRAEAVLRDIDSRMAIEPTTGKGGNRFEENVRERLDEMGFELSKNRVFKIYFRDDLHPNAYSEFVEDTAEPMYKEADLIISDTPPVVGEVFSERSTTEKRKQVQNYAEFYELATGTYPETWLITNETVEVLSLNALERLFEGA